MKKEKKDEGGADWMGTYGDMVTLLLCFFVLLYAMSSTDEGKWEIIVRAFNPDALTLVDPETAGPSNDEPESGGDVDLIPELTEEEVEQALEELFIALTTSAAAQSSETESAISVTQGDGFVFISFDDAIFFDGDSSILKQQGQIVLDSVIGPLNAAIPYIDEISVMGHTAQARADTPNDPYADRHLSSARAVEVLVYVQINSELDPARLVNRGYGQWRPIGDNSVPELQATNRRVEMMITGVDVTDVLGDSLNKYYFESGNEDLIS
ncbi:MAG: flagellar motor protein MotB [Eubacteriales bacterium]